LTVNFFTDKMKHVNLHYIRAAIEANTGVTGLSLEQVRDYLVEEGLLTPAQAKKHAHIFTGYGEFFHMIDSMEVEVESEESESDLETL